MKLEKTLALSATALLVSGCAGLMTLVNGVSVEESKRAIKENDYPKLQDICTGKTPVQSGIANYDDDACAAAIRLAAEKEDAAFLKPLCGRRKEEFGGRFGKACPAMLKIAVKQADSVAIQDLCQKDHYEDACTVESSSSAFGDLSKPDCSTLASKVQEAQKDFLKTDKTSAENYGTVVAALARCDESKLIFEGIAHFGQNGSDAYGVNVLLAADKSAGDELAKTFDGYLKKSSGKAFLATENGEFSGDHISHWLLATKRRDLCQPLVAAAKGANEEAIAGLMVYFTATECKEASPLAVQLLSSDTAFFRTTACNALGKIGDAAALPKVKTVAETDRTSRTSTEPNENGVFVKEYFVADACKHAAGKIQLRTN
jgi:hypothetical protein